MNNTQIQAFSAPLASLSKAGIEFDKDFTFEQWEAFGKSIGQAHNSALFIIGDWLNFGRKRWGKDPTLRATLEAAIRSTGLELTMLKRCANVAKRIPIDERQMFLPFETESILAKLKGDDRSEWLGIVKKEGLSSKQLKRRIRYGSEEAPKERKYESIQASVNDILRIARRRVHIDTPESQIRRILGDLEPVYDLMKELNDRLSTN